MLSTKQLAKRTNTGEGYWNRKRVDGSGPVFMKLGSRVVYRWSDVEKWLAGRARRSTSDSGEQVAA